MGSGVWFKYITSKNKVIGTRSKIFKKRYSAPEISNGYKEENCSKKEVPMDPTVDKCASAKNRGLIGLALEDIAATRIQASFRAYRARKSSRRLEGTLRLQNLMQCNTVKKQASTTLNHLHSWSRIQAEIRARRLHMVTEGRLKQKKQENQLKLEAKLHYLEVEWSGGHETMDEALSRIHQREAAALRRQRAMAYAFSHQWRANPNPNLGAGNHDLSNANWGWSWMNRWIAARPWESRVPVQSSPKKAQSRGTSKTSRNFNSPIIKARFSIKSISPSGKAARKARKLSYESTEKIAAQKVISKAEERKLK
ncbi:IQ-domain 9 [Forsythia ovata]|uniref:IQ-domain 9 n=1 Tax=Forsythia ovata TaxID=205694 RepID=A0ABD1QBU0_9LAMI